MKKKGHPEYHFGARISCACGNVVLTGSTSSDMQVEICAACHPFFTGKEKFVDSAGRVEKFQKRYGKRSG